MPSSRSLDVDNGKGYGSVYFFPLVLVKIAVVDLAVPLVVFCSIMICYFNSGGGFGSMGLGTTRTSRLLGGRR